MKTHISKVTLKGIATFAGILLLIAMISVMMYTLIYLNVPHASAVKHGKGWADILTNLALIGGLVVTIAAFCLIIRPKR